MSGEELKKGDVPPPGADWASIEEFALTFDAEEHWGSLDEIANIAKRPKSDDLIELRTALYFEQRKARWNLGPPEGEDWARVMGLLEQIRRLVAGE